MFKSHTIVERDNLHTPFLATQLWLPNTTAFSLSADMNLLCKIQFITSSVISLNQLYVSEGDLFVEQMLFSHNISVSIHMFVRFIYSHSSLVTGSISNRVSKESRLKKSLNVLIEVFSFLHSVASPLTK